MSYQPPPPEGSGNTPPEGGYAPPPPASEGGYSPPPQATGSSYSPPPPPTGGGYSPPPPPMTAMKTSGGGSGDMSHLPQSYINAVTKPSVGTYEAEIPNANITKTLIGVAIVAIVSFLFNLIFAGASAAALAPLTSQLRQSGSNIDPAALTGGAGIGGALLGLVFTFVFFFVGAGIQYLVAKMLGGQGQDFGTHAYLDSLSYTPLRVVSTVVAIIPVIGGLVGLVLILYQLYLQSLGLQASQRLPAGKAMMAAFAPAIIALVLGCISLVACAGLIASIMGAANTR